MLKKFHHTALTCAAVASAFLASSANAGIVVDFGNNDYYQEVSTYGYYPYDYSNNYSYSTGPLSTSSTVGYADITSSQVTATTISYNYSLGINGVDTYGSVYAYQDVYFHVTADTSFSYNLSAYALASDNSYNYAYLYDYTTSTYVFETLYPDYYNGAGFTFSGALVAGDYYELYTYAEPTVYYANGSTDFSMTGSSVLTLVPEPSTFALSSLLLGGFGAIGMFKRLKRKSAAA